MRAYELRIPESRRRGSQEASDPEAGDLSQSLDLRVSAAGFDSRVNGVANQISQILLGHLSQCSIINLGVDLCCLVRAVSKMVSDFLEREALRQQMSRAGMPQHVRPIMRKLDAELPDPSRDYTAQTGWCDWPKGSFSLKNNSRYGDRGRTCLGI